jgi:hypothetical protein
MGSDASGTLTTARSSSLSAPTSVAVKLLPVGISRCRSLEPLTTWLLVTRKLVPPPCAITKPLPRLADVPPVRAMMVPTAGVSILATASALLLPALTGELSTCTVTDPPPLEVSLVAPYAAPPPSSRPTISTAMPRRTGGRRAGASTGGCGGGAGIGSVYEYVGWACSHGCAGRP